MKSLRFLLVRKTSQPKICNPIPCSHYQHGIHIPLRSIYTNRTVHEEAVAEAEDINGLLSGVPSETAASFVKTPSTPNKWVAPPPIQTTIQTLNPKLTVSPMSNAHLLGAANSQQVRSGSFESFSQLSNDPAQVE